jgi:hypothetical protein
MRIHKISTFVFVAMLGAVSVRAEDLRLNPVQDVLVASGGTVAEPRNLGVSNRGGDYVRRTLLQFDLSPVKPNKVVDKVALTLTVSGYAGTEGGMVPVAVWGAIEPVKWAEADLVWGTSPWQSAALEDGRGATGLQRLATIEFGADADLASRPRITWEGEGLTNYIRRQAGKTVTLLLISEGEAKTPGLIFFSKDNRPVAKSLYPVLTVTLK